MTNHCLCSGCGEYFTTPRNFDAHRRGNFDTGHEGELLNRRCVDPATLLSKNGKRRFKQNGRGMWAGAATVVDVAGMRKIGGNRYVE